MLTCDGPLSPNLVTVRPESVVIVVYVCIGVIGTIVLIFGLVMCCKKSGGDNGHSSRSLSAVYAGLPSEVGIAESRSDIPSVYERSTYSAPQSV
jgi:hypothetical protein